MQIPFISASGAEVHRLWYGGIAKVERRKSGGKEEQQKRKRRASQASNALKIRPQKKLFHENPTPLHQHLTYRTHHQHVTAISNIVQPYTNPTPTLHRQACILHATNHLHRSQIFFRSKTYHFHLLYRPFLQAFLYIIFKHYLPIFMIPFELSIIHY